MTVLMGTKAVPPADQYVITMPTIAGGDRPTVVSHIGSRVLSGSFEGSPAGAALAAILRAIGNSNANATITVRRGDAASLVRVCEDSARMAGGAISDALLALTAAVVAADVAKYPGATSLRSNF